MIGAMAEPSPTILLVDDEDSVRKLLAFPLERDGYAVVQAADGEEALRQFAEQPVDLVVLDIMLPRLDGLVIDVPRRSVEVRGEPVRLTYVEFELLRTLAAQPGRVFSRRMLLEALWKSADYRDPRTIDVRVRHLREKLEAEPRSPEYILTVRGVGYRFRDR